MYQVRLSSLVLGTTFCLLLVLLVILRNELLIAHIDETIQYFASDAATYFNLYEDLYAQVSLDDAPALFLIGSPILFLKLAGGNIFVIQFFNLVLMGLTLWIAFEGFVTRRGRITFLAGSLVFPYFLFGFVSLNKEVYAMCSAIFFASYIVRGRLKYLVVALSLAACARYYMLVALLSLVVLIPRAGQPRYFWIVALLVFTSLAAPMAKLLIPGYSSEDVLEVSGASGMLFAKIIDSYGYALVYPIKYLALIPQRLYSFLLDSNRQGDGMEAVVSIASLVVIVLALRILSTNRSASPLVHRLLVAGFVAPIAIMWSDIMHWRYYSFTYFFFLFGVILHFVEKRRLTSARHAAPFYA